MTVRCPSCRSLNTDALNECGNCGAPLAQAEHVEFENKGTTTEYASDESLLKCPYCGGPMEEGTFEIVSQIPYRPRWIGASGAEPIGECFEFNGHRCRSCSCIVIDY